MSGPQIDSAEITQELKAVLSYVQDCDRRVHRGEIMDLQGLDRKVVILCETIAALPQKEAMSHEPQMMQLIQELEKLGQSLRTQQEIALAGGANNGNRAAAEIHLRLCFCDRPDAPAAVYS